MNQSKPKWGNIRSEQSKIDTWNKFLEKHKLGSLPKYADKAIEKAIAADKKRLAK
jgi:hypothetical protein